MNLQDKLDGDDVTELFEAAEKERRRKAREKTKYGGLLKEE